MSEMYFNDLFLMLYYEYCDLLAKNNDGFIKEKDQLRLNENLIPDEFRRKLKVAEWLRCYQPQAPSMINGFEEAGVKIAYGDAAKQSYCHPADKNAEKFLKPNHIYTIKVTIPHEWTTYVELQEFPGVVFSLHSFYPTGYSIKTVEQLIEEYGPDFNQDYQKLLQLVADYQNRPKPTETENLKTLLNEIKKDSPGCYQLMDSVEEYWQIESGERPLFEVGMVYNDGSRLIEVLCVSTQLDPNPEYGWKYFCKITENSNGFVDYYTFYETDMRIIQLADVNCSLEGLSEKELIIKEIANLCGGIFNSNNQFFPDSDESKTCTDTPKYCAGYEELQEDRGLWRVLMVSPTPNCFGEWIYFAEYINSDSK